MKRVWITGAGGLIGSHLVRTAASYAPGWEILSLTRQELELTDTAAVRARFESNPPSAVIHCAGLTRSPACQADPDLAHRLNVRLTERLVRLASDIPFVFFSTDMVFDGRKGNYAETDAVHPISVYAQTKWEGEQLVLANPRHLILRTSLTAGVSPSGDRGFNEELRNAWKSGRVTPLFTDEFRCPMAAVVTARAVWELVVAGRSGLFHLVGAERLSRWQIGELLAARWAPHIKPLMQAASLKDYPGAPRSPDTSLDCAKVRGVLSFPLPGFAEWLHSNPAEPV